MFRLGAIIKSNSNRKFIIKRSTKRILCAGCVFSFKYNPNFDSLTSCDERRNSYLNLSEELCDEVVPSGCVFAELKEGL